MPFSRNFGSKREKRDADLYGDTRLKWRRLKGIEILVRKAWGRGKREEASKAEHEGWARYSGWRDRWDPDPWGGLQKLT